MLSVTRQDAIGFQLDTAIRLWFEGGDPISAHTLACSALKIAHDVATKYGKAGMLWALLPGKYHKAATEAQNFFKHAEKDPSKVLSFNSELTKYHIYDAVNLYRTLYIGLSLPMGTFILWCSIHNPEIVSSAKLSPELAITIDKGELIGLNRDVFYAEVMSRIRHSAGSRRFSLLPGGFEGFRWS